MAGPRGQRGRRSLPGEAPDRGNSVGDLGTILSLFGIGAPIDYSKVDVNPSFGKEPGEVPYNLKVDPSLFTQQRFTGPQGFPTGMSERASRTFGAEKTFLDEDTARAIDEAAKLAGIEINKVRGISYSNKGLKETDELIKAATGQNLAEAGAATSKANLAGEETERGRRIGRYTAGDKFRTARAGASQEAGEAELRARNFRTPEFQKLFSGAQAATTGFPIATINKLLTRDVGQSELSVPGSFTPSVDRFRDLRSIQGGYTEEEPIYNTIFDPNTGKPLGRTVGGTRRTFTQGYDVSPFSQEDVNRARGGVQQTTSSPPFQQSNDSGIPTNIVPSNMVSPKLNLNLKGISPTNINSPIFGGGNDKIKAIIDQLKLEQILRALGIK